MAKVIKTNTEKIFWPKNNYTKGDLLDYYDSVSGFIMPYIKNHPHSLNRYPNGIKGKHFYQKNVDGNIDNWIETKSIYSESNNEYIKYFVCTNKQSLLYMVNMGCIEINPWFSKINNLHNPEFLAIDLDPLDIGFKKVKETALAVKEILDKAEANGFCKTSGATGLHIYVPLNSEYNFETAKEFAHVIAEMTNKLLSDITSIEREPSKRKKKVYIDYLQNNFGQTLAAPYSVRPRNGAPVSTPLEWDELKNIDSPEEFNIKSIHKRLNKKGDIFSAVLGKSVNIVKCLNNLGV